MLLFISVWCGREVLKTRKKLDKNKAFLPIPNKRKEREQMLTPNPLLSSLSPLNEQRPLVLQGEGSYMFSNCILFAFYFQGILLPSLFGAEAGVRLCSRLFSLRLQYNFPFLCKRLHYYFLILSFCGKPTYHLIAIFTKNY